MKRERKPRTRKRIACGMVIAGRRYTGIVLDVSQGGLFVQTNASPRVGSEVELELIPPGQNREKLTLRARVARKHQVPPQLLAVARGGVGLHIVDAPPGYGALVDADARDACDGSTDGPGTRRKPEAVAEVERTRFRVRVGEIDGARTRTFLVSGVSEDEAREHVLSELGEDWKVLAVESA